MIRQTRISILADRAIEAGWLLALVFAPYFFNLLTARHFEPDKATAVRALAILILAAWAIKAIERTTILNERLTWRAWWRAPLAVPALVFLGVFLFATVTSISPYISWWGSYNRLQGTYTNLSYMVIFAAIVGNLRTRAQLDRLITTVILTGFSVAVYGLIQHAGNDPLPWKGDVLSRISSTMGNAIFVAAYLILVVPLVLMRIVTSAASLRLGRDEATINHDLFWAIAFIVLLVGQQALLLGLLKFGAAIRVSDFRYWWVFPAGLIVVTASFAVVSQKQTLTAGRALTGLVLGLLAGWTLVLLMVYTASRGVQQLDTNPLVTNWWVWTTIGVICIGASLAATFFLPRRSQEATPLFVAFELAGYTLVLIVLLLAIFFSQSRGPQIGMLAGLAVFINLLLWRLGRNATAAGSPRTRLLRRVMVAVLALEVAAGAFLITFNVSHAPVFNNLRQIPYFGRLGQFLDTQDTGRVRTLIWAGDGQGKGAVGLILSNPVRTIIGYGPETMFTAYNPFYPPELGNIEARGASPDRSHQAELDELVTKGLLGLLSYFFLFFSAGSLAWRLARRSTNLAFQMLYIACLTMMVAHLFEGLTGIPIVSTLLMIWVAFGILVAGGVLDGQLTLTGSLPAELPEAAPVPELAPVGTSSRPGRQGTGARAGSGGRGTQSGTRGGRGTRAGAGTAVRASARSGVGSFRWTYIAIAGAALLGVWFWNLRVDYADMWYNQAAAFQPTNADEEVYKYSRVLNAVTNAPEEDYYYLQLGNSLIQLAYGYKARNPQSEADVAPVRPGQTFQDLFNGATANERALNTWQNNSAEQLLEYARIVLERARELNPYNKDHSANLGRLQALWYGLHNDQSHLDASLKWYAVAHEVAPNDVVILNEWATTLASAGSAKFDEVEAKLKQSETLDPRYPDTYVKLGNLYRIRNQPALAVDQYVQAIQRQFNALEDGREGSLEPAIAGLKSDPASLKRLLDAYEKAAAQHPKDASAQSAVGRVAAALGDTSTVRTAFNQVITMAPDDVKFRTQYTLALSATQQYDAALQQAQAGLQLAQSKQSKPDIDSLTKLVEDVQRRKASGGS